MTPSAVLADAARLIEEIGEAALCHHGDEPKSVLLHALQVEIPAVCEAARRAVVALSAFDAARGGAQAVAWVRVTERGIVSFHPTFDDANGTGTEMAGAFTLRPLVYGDTHPTPAPATQAQGEAQAVALPKRGDVGSPEATRDPIFLLEKRRIRLGVNVPADHRWNSDTERMETPELGGESAFTINEYAAAYPDNVNEEWLPESVWFTREEAEAFRVSHAYRWPLGSRVYCLCAEGELAALLKARTAYRGAVVPDLYTHPTPPPGDVVPGLDVPRLPEHRVPVGYGPVEAYRNAETGVVVVLGAPDADHSCDEMGCGSVGPHVVARGRLASPRPTPPLGEVERAREAFTAAAREEARTTRLYWNLSDNGRSYVLGQREAMARASQATMDAYDALLAAEAAAKAKR